MSNLLKSPRTRKPQFAKRDSIIDRHLVNYSIIARSVALGG